MKLVFISSPWCRSVVCLDYSNLAKHLNKPWIIKTLLFKVVHGFWEFAACAFKTFPYRFAMLVLCNFKKHVLNMARQICNNLWTYSLWFHILQKVLKGQLYKSYLHWTFWFLPKVWSLCISCLVAACPLILVDSFMSRTNFSIYCFWWSSWLYLTACCSY